MKRNGKATKTVFLGVSLLVGLACVYGTTRWFLALSRPDLLLQITAYKANANRLLLQFRNVGPHAFTLDISAVECFAVIRSENEGTYTAHIRNRPPHAIAKPSPPIAIPSGTTLKMLGILPDLNALPKDCTQLWATYSVKQGQTAGGDAWRGEAVSYPYILERGR